MVALEPCEVMGFLRPICQARSGLRGFSRMIDTIGNGSKRMMHIALWEPEIPPNTGNVARLCAATGTVLHLIGRLGFRIDDRTLKRAGLDYWDAVEVRVHDTFGSFEQIIAPERIICIETPAPKIYTEASFASVDCILFGSESKGLPPEVRERYTTRTYSIPMPTGKVRSLNLATSVGIVLYEALRQRNSW
jgi:tRNA (cytidine/uridine-2'-O-)-methyltransferase